MVSAGSLAGQIRERLQHEKVLWIDASLAEYWETVAELADEVDPIEYDVEYIHQQIRAKVSQASDNHELIVLNIGAILRQLFYDQTDIRVMGSNKLVFVPACELAVNPDVLVMRGPSQLLPRPGKAAGIINPYMLIEVHSSSTERNDMFTKLACYKKMESLQQIIYVGQHQRHVSVYSRTADAHHWLNDDYEAPDALISLGDSTIALADIYHKVTFGQPG